MEHTFNWGIVGLGKIAHEFAKDISITEKANLIAVASRSITKAAKFAREHKVSNFYGSYEQILECKELDVVYIATPHSLHCELSIFFMENGIPVLCEKPMAINRQQVQKMILASRGLGIFLMEALWTRFLPSTNMMLKLVMNGTIGEVINIKADFGFAAKYDPDSRLFDPRLGGGSLLDVGIYPIFLSLLLMGKPNNIIANASFSKSGVDEYCKFIFEYDGVKTAFLESSLVKNTGTTAEIIGTKGVILLHARWHESAKLTVIFNSGERRNYEFDYKGKGYNFEIIEVMKCLSNKQLESEFMSLNFTKDLVELMDKVRQKTGIVYPEDKVSALDESFSKIYNN